MQALLLHSRTHDNMTLFDLPQGVAILLDDGGWQGPASKFWQIEEIIGVGVIGFGYFQVRIAERRIDNGALEGRVALADDVTQRKVFLRHRRTGVEIHLI